MEDWSIVQADPADKLVRLHFFAVMKPCEAGEVEFRITIREHATNPGNGMHFFAQADRQTNQSTAPFTPSGWGNSLSQALSECIRAIHRFPYEGPLPGREGSSAV